MGLTISTKCRCTTLGTTQNEAHVLPKYKSSYKTLYIMSQSEIVLRYLPNMDPLCDDPATAKLCQRAGTYFVLPLS